MTEQFFDSQISRLRSQWSHSYGKERRDLFWNAFRNVPENIFSEAIGQILASSRQAPMLTDLDKAVNQAINDSQSFRLSTPYGFGNLLTEAQSVNKRADRDFVATAIKHLKLFMTGGLTKDAFFQGCDDLDKLADLLNPPPRDYPTKHVALRQYKNNPYKRYENRFNPKD